MYVYIYINASNGGWDGALAALAMCYATIDIGIRHNGHTECASMCTCTSAEP